MKDELGTDNGTAVDVDMDAAADADVNDTDDELDDDALLISETW